MRVLISSPLVILPLMAMLVSCHCFVASDNDITGIMAAASVQRSQRNVFGLRPFILKQLLKEPPHPRRREGRENIMMAGNDKSIYHLRGKGWGYMAENDGGPPERNAIKRKRSQPLPPPGMWGRDTSSPSRRTQYKTSLAGIINENFNNRRKKSEEEKEMDFEEDNQKREVKNLREFLKILVSS